MADKDDENTAGKLIGGAAVGLPLCGVLPLVGLVALGPIGAFAGFGVGLLGGKVGASAGSRVERWIKES